MNTELRSQLIEALERSEEHWEENLRLFENGIGSQSQFDWFWDNGTGENCALCRLTGEECLLYDEEARCYYTCPLVDFPDALNMGYQKCCEEWQALRVSSIPPSSITVELIQAVLDRIKKELKDAKDGVTYKAWAGRER